MLFPFPYAQMLPIQTVVVLVAPELTADVVVVIVLLELWLVVGDVLALELVVEFEAAEAVPTEPPPISRRFPVLV